MPAWKRIDDVVGGGGAGVEDGGDASSHALTEAIASKHCDADYAGIVLQSRENLNLAQNKLQALSRLLGHLHASGSYMYLYCVLGQ